MIRHVLFGAILGASVVAFGGFALVRFLFRETA